MNTTIKEGFGVVFIFLTLIIGVALVGSFINFMQDFHETDFDRCIDACEQSPQYIEYEHECNLKCIEILKNEQNETMKEGK